ncbi:hypothetical protein [Novosphingobium sp. AP12]|uniref:hypothetical protein n=1 Tax=Novosphingobium sp. AP12 TaxID=1144305 RepID=UPI000272197D|nr:hypothetical protein [Novosphingobium sp. AP12]EJL33736.1 hypothetical protein PMI02_00973 [Novosphingobium sp. AP12]
MTRFTFHTPDGEEIEIDGDDVVSVSTGDDSETTLVELEDGDEVVVAAGKLEVIAQLGLDPLEHDEIDNDATAGDFDEDD